jgi:hypothetical protein
LFRDADTAGLPFSSEAVPPLCIYTEAASTVQSYVFTLLRKYVNKQI